nr:hypothetical protein GCM10020185_51710 [Pseudomonas brassicacearum subsp. brassicacearum]
MVEDVQIHTFDPQRDGQAAHVAAVDWLGGEVLRLRITPRAVAALSGRAAPGAVGR